MADESEGPGAASPTPNEPVRRGRRSQSRLRLHLAIRITATHGAFNAILSDLSTTGARIVTDEPLRRGQAVVLSWSGMEAFGELRWREGDTCGIGFIEPVAHDLVLLTRALDAEGRQSDARDVARQAAEAFVQGRVKL